MSQRSQITRKRKPLTQFSLDEATSTQKKVRRKEQDENFRRAGTVNHITLKNFMCHSLLEVDFNNNNISIVIGKNGSGKSAILTALIVGLGGRASLTNRGTSVKGFVKVGKNSASIEIELYNGGPMGYKPLVYGDTITIIRNLTASGSSSYKIKSAEGEVISTQVKEVQNITLSLNIQVDNPICILTQDTSRNFLSSNNPNNKFALFMRATRLETLKAEYDRVLKNKNECSRILTEKKTNFAKLQDEIKRLRTKIEGHQSIVDLKEKKISLQKEMLWAQVRDVEDELKEEQDKMAKLVKKLKDLEMKKGRNAEQIENFENDIVEYERQLRELKEELGNQKKREENQNKQLMELQKALTSKMKERQAASIEIEKKNRDAKYLTKEIANANENMTKVEQLKKQRIDKLQTMQDKLKGFDDHLHAARDNLFQIKTDLGQKQHDMVTLRHEIEEIDNKIAKEKGDFQALQRQSGNSLVLYGKNIPKVLEAIERHKDRFQHEPKGPLGSYIKLRDKKWSVAVEGYLGASMLGAFTVDNQKDSKLLQQILVTTLEPNDYQPPIITSKFIYKKHDVKRNLVAAPDDCVCLYDVVTIDDPVVSNCIVDQKSIENILLIPNNGRAMELMSNRSHVPANCKQALTLAGDQYYPDPNYKTYASTYRRARFLQVDTKDHIELIKETITNLTNKRQVIQRQLQSVEKELQEQMTKQHDLEEKIKKVNVAKRLIRDQYTTLMNELEPEMHDLNNLENELEDVKRTIAEKTALLESVGNEMKQIKISIASNDENVKKMRSATNGLEQRSLALQEQIDKNNTKRRELSANENFELRRMKEFQERIDAARSEVALKQSQMELKTADAAELGDRPVGLRSVKEIFNEVQETSKTIRHIEREAEKIEDVSLRYRELVEKYTGVVDIIKLLYKNYEELNKAVEHRKKHYKLTENYFVTFMKHSFKKILEVRQFKGTIDIQMDQQKLDLIVMPQQGSQGLTTTSNLSGGEKSFSTVAFLYSLWQCMDFPFYFLDEFDVYMDKLNRSKVIEILLRYANSKPDLQFVFLTPQDISFIKQNVSVFKLKDPERFDV